MIGDGHTWITDRFAHDPYQLYPLYLRWFDDGIYLVGVSRDFSDLIGSRLIGINEWPVQSVLSEMDVFIPKFENRFYLQYWEGYWLRNADALIMEGIASQGATARFTFLSEKEDTVTIKLTQREAEVALDDLVWAYNPVPLFMTRNSEPLWYKRYDNKNVFYIKLNTYPSKKHIRPITGKILEELLACNPQKIVFDLRRNGGGDKTVGEWMINKLIDAGWASRSQFFAITGDHTFSAALANAVYLREKAGALIIGEPPTNRPNFYSENLFLRLPIQKSICPLQQNSTGIRKMK
jgi:hypothetical protein